MTFTYLALQAPPNDWIPIGISLLALVCTLGNYLLTLSRGRKHVHITSWLSIPFEGNAMYCCRVTNTGYIGVQVDSVSVSPSGRTSLGLRLQEGEKPKKLDQGESQEWQTELDFLLEHLLQDPALLKVNIEREETESAWLKVSIEGLETKVLAVAEDTAGKKYVQKQKEAIAFQRVLDVGYQSEYGSNAPSPWQSKESMDVLAWLDWLTSKRPDREGA